MKRLRIVATTLGAIASCLVMADGPLHISAEPAWKGLNRNLAIPLAVEIQNPTASPASGTLQVTTPWNHFIYPVEIPAGGVSHVLTYPEGFGSELNLVVDTNLGRSSERVTPLSPAPPTPTPATPNVSTYPSAWLLSISERPNAYQFLDTPETKGAKHTFSVGDSPIENAPARSSAYGYLNVVMLGSGAEKLTDIQVEALRNYALTGGTIAFVGGTSGNAINDPRWADIMPAKDFHSTRIDSAFLRAGRVTLPSTSIITGTATPGSVPVMEGDKLIASTKTYGLGKVVYFGFDPTSPELSGWSGRKAAVAGLLRASDRGKAAQFCESSTSTSTPSGSTPDDPFSFRLPPVEQVFGLLSLYFVLVVPVNFLVLRKLKRPELAWVTAPVLSLGFAGILFANTRGLYGAQMASATQGLIVAHEGEKEGMFIGNSQFFIPQGGFYDLGLKNVETASVGSGISDSYQSVDSAASYETRDLGTEVQVPNLRATNLAFNNISYRQRVDISNWFKVERLPGRKWKVTNTSPYSLDVSLVTGTDSYGGLPLAPGESGTISITQPLGVENDLELFLKTGNQVALYGRVTGFRPGPQIGTDIKDRSNIAYAYFLEETL